VNGLPGAALILVSMAVTPERWAQAQTWESEFWSRAERRRGWRKIAYPLVRPFLLATGNAHALGDDSNLWWRDQFALYAFLDSNLGDYIELGCGPYTNTRLILEGRTTSRAVCSDPLARMYVGFRDRWLSRAYRSGLVEIDTSPIEELPFPRESFDTVVVINVLDHVRDVDLCLERAIGLVRPGGWFLLGQDLARPDTIGQYEWFDEGHPHRILPEHLGPHLLTLTEQFRRLVPPRDDRLQQGVLAYAGRKPRLARDGNGDGQRPGDEQSGARAS
jgi:SAM-dependent methyltransferase